ncbi:sigma-70 family RNA polymerase sigma factor [Glaciimonas sp. GS1]|uniref:Sigma-70 family RNA polymerase sigma factor n=2 Tax=Glaciimonas soli TaxID=2590999 RepID=A0A843YJG5_9BURK|nr:sigma-70 family RNA polymerase sigma factor [Glaciimonas soli]
MTDQTKEERFQAIVLPHLNSAFNLARWLTGSHQDAEDVVQEAYLRAYTFFDSFNSHRSNASNGGEDGRPWLLAIVRNTFYTWYEQKQTRNAHTALFDEQSDDSYGHHNATGEDPNEFANVHQQANNDPENLLLQKDCEQQLQLALRTLPLEFREVMILRELEDLSYKQIAAIVDIPIGTVMSRLGRGRQLLAKKLIASGVSGVTTPVSVAAKRQEL